MKFTDRLFHYSLLIVVSFGSFEIGQAWKYHQLKPTIIEHQGGHYDPTTGDFVWGAFDKQYNNAGMDELCKNPKAAKEYACVQWNQGKQQ